jgi:hypothetical protein
MRRLSITLLSTATLALTALSIWANYVSLSSSVLPKPTFTLSLVTGAPWHCSLPALGLAMAIGLLLLAIKVSAAGQDRSIGITGYCAFAVVASFSILFNMDAIYRVAQNTYDLQLANQQPTAVFGPYMVALSIAVALLIDLGDVLAWKLIIGDPTEARPQPEHRRMAKEPEFIAPPETSASNEDPRGSKIETPTKRPPIQSSEILRKKRTRPRPIRFKGPRIPR